MISTFPKAKVGRSIKWHVVIVSLATLMIINLGSGAASAVVPRAEYAVGLLSVFRVSAVATSHTPATTVNCVPSLGHYDRTQACWEVAGVIHVFTSEGILVGQTNFTIAQSIQLHAIGRTFSEQLTFVSVTSSGTAPIWSLNLSVSCGSPCAATNHFPQGSKLSLAIRELFPIGTQSAQENHIPQRVATNLPSKPRAI